MQVHRAQWESDLLEPIIADGFWLSSHISAHSSCVKLRLIHAKVRDATDPSASASAADATPMDETGAPGKNTRKQVTQLPRWR